MIRIRNAKRWSAVLAAAILTAALTGCQKGKKAPAAGDDNLLKVAIVDSQNEFACYDEKKDVYTGREPELIGKIASDLQLQVEYVKAERGRETEKIDLGEAELAVGCIPLDSLLKKQYAVSIPYGKGRLYVVTRRGDFSDSLGDFLEKETGSSEKLRKAAALSLAEAGESQAYSSQEQAAKDLISGKITGYFCYEKEALELCGRTGLQAQSLVNAEPEKYVLIMAQGEQDLMRRINVSINSYLDGNE